MGAPTRPKCNWSDAFAPSIASARGATPNFCAFATSKRLKLWAVAGPNRIHLYIKDNGTGMTRDVEKRAFDPFFTTKGEQGVGMGLYIAYHLAKKMNCQLAIKRTKRGEGTEFELILPRHDSEEGNND